jgi:drug/metabolite transporter (DMT)-like permease
MDIPARRPGLGIVLAVLATLCFALLHTISKYAGKLLVPVLMAIWLRFMIQTLMTAALLWPQYRSRLFQARAPGWQLARGVLMIGSFGLSFLSLRFLPVGEFTAIMMLVPLAVTLLASLILRERVGPLAWLCVAGGFTGALIVIRPHGSDFHLGLLLPLLSVLVNALLQVLTSRIVRRDDAGVTHFYTGLVGLVCTSLAVPFGWQWLADWHQWAAIALMGLCGSIGHYLLIQAFQHAPASRVAPYLYSQIGFATLAGWAAFGQAPDALALLGIAVIALSGLASARLRRS